MNPLRRIDVAVSRYLDRHVTDALATPLPAPPVIGPADARLSAAVAPRDADRSAVPACTCRDGRDGSPRYDSGDLATIEDHATLSVRRVTHDVGNDFQVGVIKQGRTIARFRTEDEACAYVQLAQPSATAERDG